MQSVDFTNPREVCRRLAELHVTSLRRQATLDALAKTQEEDDVELDRLRRLVLVMACDGTAIRVENVPDATQRFAGTSVAIVVEDRTVICHELTTPASLPDMLECDVQRALDQPPSDPRIALEAALMDLADDDGIEWSERADDGALRIPASVFGP